MSPSVYAIGNRKGGVGKTTVTGALAWALALRSRKVLVVELDPQGNLSDWLLDEMPDTTIFDVLYADTPGILGDAAVPSLFPGVDIVPADETLARMEAESMVTPEMRLKTAMHGSEALEAYDVVLIDLPPALGRLTLNGLLAADGVIAVTLPEAFAIGGLVAFLETIETVQSRPHLNPDLKFEGIVVNGYDDSAEHRFQLSELADSYKDVLLEPVLPKRTAVRDAVSRQIPLTKVRSQGSVELQEAVTALSTLIWKGKK